MLRSDSSIKGRLAGLLSLNPESTHVADSYLSVVAGQFFTARGHGPAESLVADLRFHEFDFCGKSKLPINRLYSILLEDAVRLQNGWLFHTPRYQWSLDIAECPLTCALTGLRYSVVTVGKLPLIYTMYLPLADIIAYLRKYYETDHQAVSNADDL
jgi:hypothetical protein